jgi:hypothetical protein
MKLIDYILELRMTNMFKRVTMLSEPTNPSYKSEVRFLLHMHLDNREPYFDIIAKRYLATHGFLYPDGVWCRK